MDSRPNAGVIAKAEQLLQILREHDGSDVYQAKVMRQLDQLRCHLETGPDALMYHSTPMLNTTAMKVMMDFGVFDAVPYQGRIYLEDLAATVRLDSKILHRFLRLLVSQGVLSESAPAVFEHTSSSRMFRVDHAAAFYRLMITQFPQWYKAAEYLKSHSAFDFQDATKVPYSWALGKEGKTYYDVIEDDPDVSDVWHEAMVMLEMTQPITDMFPFASMEAAVKAEPQRPFVVDVGGGRGNALATMIKTCDGSYGAKMVLQDKAEVLMGQRPVQLDGVEVMPYDFFEPQPMRNAHIYFLRFILHNYYDNQCLRILRNIADAMGLTSRLLIGETILPTIAGPGADSFPFAMDLCMFMQGGTERTEEQFHVLLKQAGLKIEKIWRHPRNPNQAMIEAVLAM